MTDKITSTAELRKWVKDRIHFLKGLGFISTAGLEKSKALVLELNFVLEKINEFEAGLKEKAGSLFPYKECLKEWRIDCTGMNYCPCSFFCDFIKREILGDDKSG